MSEQALGPPQHEPRDVGLGFALRAAALVGGCLVATVVVLVWIFPRTIGESPVPARLPAPPAPRLQSSPREEMARLRREELQRLDSYGWIDRASGRVHIPIDVAMRKLAAEGIPGWPGTAP